MHDEEVIHHFLVVNAIYAAVWTDRFATVLLYVTEQMKSEVIRSAIFVEFAADGATFDFDDDWRLNFALDWSDTRRHGFRGAMDQACANPHNGFGGAKDQA